MPASPKGRGSNAASARCSRSCLRARSATSWVAAGPAASSAIVTAETATCAGSCSGCNCSRSMTTDVSSRPTTARSGTRLDLLIDADIKVLPEPLPADRWSTTEDVDDCTGVDEATTPQRAKFAHRFCPTGHDVGMSLVQPAHDAPAVIAQLPLTDLLAHLPIVAPGATRIDSSHPPRRTPSGQSLTSCRRTEFRFAI